tara:strand:+ start:5514 stop:6044 length:531 start_codon:yes stop_codon:yes gene_type:complete
MDLQPVKNIATKIQIILGTKLIELGRNASGELINSLQHDITQNGEFGFDLSIKGNSYWRVVEYGVSANNIPYDASVRTGAGNSDYINGLIRWIKVKGIASDNDTIRGIAFAIATKQTATSRGGYGLGNPMDKQKLGFVKKSETQINEQIKQISSIYETEVKKLIGDAFPSNFEIII